ncbi:hypothetical protein [Rahnella aquatilis]|uniref:hypothetical protein n=1 Tax=Rahnella aquatilis TaxID=34038 RepID=UPI0012E0AAB1|nr:hypothetical protein [Rahnella aquatilis]
MGDIFQLVKTFRECVGDGVAASMLNTPFALITAWYARRRLVNNRIFTTVSDKKRLEVFKQIKALWQEEPDDLTRAVIKTLYESIGLTYPIQVNRRIVDALDHEGIDYRDYRVSCFLQCRYVMNISAKKFTFLQTKSDRRKRVLLLFPVVALLFCSAGLTLSMQLSAVPVLSFTFIFFTWLYLIVWLWTCSLSINEWERLNKAGALWKQISPYLNVSGTGTVNQNGGGAL